jgi:ABC-type transport system involved in cytochrome c biogenesis permease component
LIAVVLMLGGFGFAEIDFINHNPSAAEQGRLLFQIFSWLAFVFAALAGLIGTADCMSSEKREGTLGLLFLTDLKGYDVICGKLAANSVAVIYGLVASVPILCLPIVMGGVGALDFIKVVLLLLTVLALSCSLGIFISTYSRNERKSTVYAILVMLGILFLPILAGAVMENRDMISEESAMQIGDLSPVFSMAFVFVLPRVRPFALTTAFWQYHVWITLCWLWLLIAIFLTRASRKAPVSWQQVEGAPSVLTKPLKLRVRKWSPSRVLLDLNPYHWLALRGETTPRAVWGFTISMFAIWVVAIMRYGTYMWDPDVLVPTVVIINTFLKIWIVAEASRRFVEDRQNNALEFLLSTPLSQRDVIRGQWRALWSLFGLPVIAVALCEWFITHRMVARFEGTHFIGTRTPLFLVADALALAAVALWFALKFNGRVRVMVTAFALVTVLPQLVDFVTEQMLSVYSNGLLAGTMWATQPRDNLELGRVKFVTLTTILFDCLVFLWASTKVNHNFRRLATERFSKA